jgi:uncharacterized protein YjlB
MAWMRNGSYPGPHSTLHSKARGASCGPVINQRRTIGSSTLSVDGEQFEFAAGDIVHLPPGSTHQVINDSAEDFEYYGIWWDTDMSAKFVTRHQDEA